MSTDVKPVSSLAQGPVFETKIEQVGGNIEMLLNLGPQHPATLTAVIARGASRWTAK